MESLIKIDDLEVPLFLGNIKFMIALICFVIPEPPPKNYGYNLSVCLFRYSNHVAMNVQDGKTPTDGQGVFSECI